MINRIVEFSLRNRFLIIVAYLALGGWGWWALRATPIDAIPDLSDNQVIVFTDWPGHSAQEVEDQVTYPITVNLQGLPGVRVVRSQSAFGFSMVYAILDDDVDLYFARSRVLERLNLIGALLPPGVVPVLGPDATGVGHVFWYTVESASHSLRELRSLQDWFIRYQLNAVPGVAEVASVGGHVQQYQIDVDPARLRAQDVPLSAVLSAVRGSNRNVGGNVLEASGTWTIIRGVGLIESVEDIERIAVKASAGAPVTVRQVADVKIGHAFRTSALVSGGDEVVGGVVVARSGANARAVIADVKARLAQIEPALPPGVRIVPFYDRSRLIDDTVGTLRIALIEEIVLVTLAHVLFLMHARSILIVTLPLPLAVLMSFLGMYYLGVSSNIMSLAGIAIAIGVLVDAAIVVTENAFRYLERHGIDMRDRAAVAAGVLASTRLVARPVFFSMLIILLAFVPVFGLTGQEGKLFHPLAFTKTFAVLAATLMALTLVPVLCTLLLRGRLHDERTNPIMRAIGGVYRPALLWALSHRVATVAIAGALLGGALVAGSRIGNEFMPPLNEGDLLFMPIADPSVSLDQNVDIARRQNLAMMAIPEVELAVAKVGRADTSTDPSPLNMTETVIRLRPQHEWRPGMTLARLRSELDQAAQLPGVANIWTMPIINRIDMLSTGVRSEVGVKVFGPDPIVLEQTAQRVADVLAGVPGAGGVYAEPLTGSEYLNLEVDRDAAARHGLSVGDVQDVIETAIGERPLTVTIEGRQRFPVRVRYAPEWRGDAASIGDVLVATPAGAQIPLKEVTRSTAARGAAMLNAENGLLVATVLLNVQGRDTGGFVADAQAAVAAGVVLPPGYFLDWSGRFENQARARARLQLVVPLVLLVIFVLLYFTYGSVLEAAHVLLAVPFALTGGVYLLWALDYNFSVAVWVGFIALFGTAVQTTVVMVIYLQEAVERHRGRDGLLTREGLHAAVVEGALLRLRPKMMTVGTVIAALLPLMWSTRPGAEVMRPLATPVLGGMVSSLLHVLVVTPVLFFWIHQRRLGPAAETVTARSAGAVPGTSAGTRGRRLRLAVIGILVLLTGAALASWTWWHRHTEPAPDIATLVHEQRSGDLMVRVLAPGGGLTTGVNQLLVEFRSAATGALVDVGDVRVAANMPMPGMVMSGTTGVTRSTHPGVYVVRAELGMAGAWQMRIDWNGPAGRDWTSFEGTVR